MCTATVDLGNPNGVPVTLHISPDDEDEAIIVSVEQAEKIALYFAARGWTFARADALEPSAGEPAQAPTFAGFPCSPTVDERGLPTWIIVDGKQAQRRQKQGDVWYSVKLEGGGYAQVLLP